MTWMNEWEIDNAVDRYRDHPVLGPAVLTLSDLRDITNRKSDGWHMWPKPAHAASKLMDMIAAAAWDRHDSRYAEPTPAALRAALVPIKAFRTRMNKQMAAKYGVERTWDFKITERLPTEREKLSAGLMEAERAARDHTVLADRYLAEARELARQLAALDS
jgi:hypothetical protein